MSATATQQQREELLTVKEVAQMLRVSVGWVYGHTKGGVFPVLPHVSLGSRLVVRRADLAMFLETRRSGVK